MSNHKSSFVWLYFDKIRPDLVQCKLCQKKLKFCGSTNTMSRHIHSLHREQLDTANVSNHVRHSLKGREAVLEEAVRKYMTTSDSINYNCTLCSSEFKMVKDTVHLMRHVLCKHPGVLKEFESRPQDGSTEGKDGEDEGGQHGRVEKVQRPLVTGRRCKKHPSFVWSFMTKIALKRLRCNLCGMVYVFSGTTSAMRAHIIAKHPQELEMVEQGHALEVPTISSGAAENNMEQDIVVPQNETNGFDQTSEASDKEELDAESSRPIKRRSIHTDDSAPENDEGDEEDLMQSYSDEDYDLEIPKPKKLRSFVWKFMTRLASDKVGCKLCGKLLKFNNSTTTMRTHIFQMHPKELEMVEQGQALDLPTLSVGAAESDTIVKQQNPSDNQANNCDQVGEGLDKEEVIVERIGPFTKRRKFSIAWRFMRRISQTKVMCRLCRKIYQYFKSTGTTKFLKHIEKFHPFELARAKGLQYPNSSPVVKHATKSPVRKKAEVEPSVEGTNSSRPKLQKLDCLANMLVGSLYPSSFVERESFKIFAQSLNPKFSVPDKELWEQTIVNMYKKQRGLLERQLEKASSIAISSDIWTYRERQQCLTVTGHFTSDKWTVQSRILKTVPLSRRMDPSASVAIKLEEILKKWKIFDKIQCVLINGTESMIDAMNQLDKPYVCCLALALNRTVLESLKTSDDISYLIKRVRDVESFLHDSMEACEQLKQVQMKGNKTPKKLILDTDSDWISTYKMLKIYLELHSDLAQALDDVTDENILLVDEEVELLTRCVQALEPFALAAQDLAGDSFTTLSKALPVLDILKQMVSNLSKVGQGLPAVEYLSAIAFARELRVHLEKWMNTIGDRQQVIPWAATLLDPRFKHMVLEDPEMLQSVKTHLEQLMDPKENTNRNDQPAVSQVSDRVDTDDTSLLWSTFDQTIKKYVHEEPVDELQRYIDESCITRQEDPFGWWREREHLYPKLSSVVKQFLYIPATSVPPSQVFVEAEKRNLSLRNFIDEAQLDSVLFLSSCDNPSVS